MADYVKWRDQPASANQLAIIDGMGGTPCATRGEADKEIDRLMVRRIVNEALGFRFKTDRDLIAGRIARCASRRELFQVLNDFTIIAAREADKEDENDQDQ